MTVRHDRSIIEQLSKLGPGFPRTLSISDEAPQTRLLLDVSENLCWFRGHFPVQPVLPGIVQLHWATLVSRTLYGFDTVPLEIKRLKFKKIVVPPSELEMILSQPSEYDVLFRFESLGEVNSEGLIVFSQEA